MQYIIRKTAVLGDIDSLKMLLDMNEQWDFKKKKCCQLCTAADSVIGGLNIEIQNDWVNDDPSLE